jgi:hypothetical protein
MTRTALITGRRPESDARRRSGSRAAVSRRCRTGSVMSTCWSTTPGDGVQIVLTHTFDREEGTGKPVCVAEAVVRSHEPAAPEDRSPGAAGSARWPTCHLPSSAITGSITAVEAQAACVPLGAVNAPFLIS